MDAGGGVREDHVFLLEKEDGRGQAHTLRDLVAPPSSSQQEALCPTTAFHGPFPENSECPRQPVSPLSRLLSHSAYDKESESGWVSRRNRPPLKLQPSAQAWYICLGTMRRRGIVSPFPDPASKSPIKPSVQAVAFFTDPAPDRRQPQRDPPSWP